MAWNIVQHAFRMVFGNLSQALKVSLVPFGLLVLFGFIVFSVSGVPLSGFGTEATYDAISRSPALSLLLLLCLSAFAFFVMGWVAVSWHRFILLEEYTTLIPASRGRPIWTYVWRSFVLGFLVSLIALPLLFIVGLFIGPAAAAGVSGFSFFALVMGFIVGIVLTYFWFRWAVILPSTAVGKPMGLSEAWSQTAAISSTIFQTAVIVTALKIAASTLVSLFYVALPLVAFACDLVVNWATLMVGVSILTTLYGHVVEGRPLSGA